MDVIKSIAVGSAFYVGLQTCNSTNTTLANVSKNAGAVAGLALVYFSGSSLKDFIKIGFPIPNYGGLAFVFNIETIPSLCSKINNFSKKF